MKYVLSALLFLVVASGLSAQNRASRWIIAPFWGCQFDATNVRFTAQNEVTMYSASHGSTTTLPAGVSGAYSVRRFSFLSVGLFVGKFYPRWVLGTSLHAHGMWDVLKQKIQTLDGHNLQYRVNPDIYEDEGFAFMRYHRPWSALAQGGIRFPDANMLLLFGAGITRCHTGLATREYHWGFLGYEYNIYKSVIPNPNYRPVFRVTGVWRSMFASVEYMNGISAQVGLTIDWLAMLKRNQQRRQASRQTIEHQTITMPAPRHYDRVRTR